MPSGRGKRADPPERRALTPLPTPLDLAPRFSAALGREVLIKRDDLGSLGLAGNKVRKLEYIVSQAEAEEIDAFVVVGASQSNAARTVAAVAASTGRRCVIVVPDEPQALDRAEGNLLLSLLFGAEIRFIGACDWSEAEEAADRISREIEISGQRVMTLPTGCSSPLGIAGFVAAHRELIGQLETLERQPCLVVHASSSGGTAAGLQLGRLLHGGPPILSVDVGRLFDDMAGRIASLAGATAELLHVPHAVSSADVTPTFDFMGAGYARPTDAALDAIRLLARTEGILCDPVYSGKALAAVCAGAGASGGSPVVFWHTGGAQSVTARRIGHQLLDRRAERS